MRSSASTIGCSTGSARNATCAVSSRSTISSPCASRTHSSPPPSTPCPVCSPPTTGSPACASTMSTASPIHVPTWRGCAGSIGDDRWLLVEKILAPGERLPDAWPVDGTTGYEHAAVLEHALLDADGWDLLRRRWVAETGDRRPFRDWELDARREVLAAGAAPGPRAGRPRRRRPSRRRRGHGRGRGRRAERAPRPLPHVPSRRRGRSGAHARPRRSRGEPAAPGAGAGEAGDRAARQRRRRGRRVAYPLAAVDRSGDGQGRGGSSLLALRHAGVARRGRRLRRATGRCGSCRRPPRASRRHGGTVADDVAGRDDPRHQALGRRPCRGAGARRPVAAVRRVGGRVVRRARLALLDRPVDPVAGAADGRHNAWTRRVAALAVPRQGRAGGRRAHGVDRP